MKPYAKMWLWVSHKPWKCNTFVAQLQDLVMLGPSIYLSDCFEVQLVKEWPCILLFICVVNAIEKMLPRYKKNKQNAAKFYFNFITTVDDQDLDKSTVDTSTLDTSY